MTPRVDLRSDTVTKPSPAMRRAIAEAEVGDDRYGDDPTVNRLEERAAELTGREAAVYLPTGTMCNQIAMHALARAGRFVACGPDQDRLSPRRTSRLKDVTRPPAAMG
jgi:threonine aldolase